MLSPPYNRVVSQGRGDGESQRSPGGFHLYNINEMVSAIGKKKKLPTTLGLNLATGTIMIAPEKSRDGPQQEWSAEKLTHYSIEGKHVFMELVRPSKSADFHAGAKGVSLSSILVFSKTLMDVENMSRKRPSQCLPKIGIADNAFTNRYCPGNRSRSG